MTSVRILTGDDVDALLAGRMGDLIDRLADAFVAKSKASATNVPRRRTKIAEGLFYQELAGGDEALFGSKLYLAGPAIGGVTGIVVVFDRLTGRPRAIVDATKLNRWRTGAVSGVATKWLAKPRAGKLCLVGAGRQASAQLRGVLAVRPIEEVVVLNRSRERANRFCEAFAAEMPVRLRPADSAADALHGADVVVTVTSSSSPVLSGADVTGPVHVNAVGANKAGKHELAPDLMAKATLIAVDDVAQARGEATDIVAAVQEERVSWEDVVDLGETCGKEPPSASGGISIFESQGVGMADVVAAGFVCELAEQVGRGLKVDF